MQVLDPARAYASITPVVAAGGTVHHSTLWLNEIPMSGAKALDAVFAALADPTRRAILALLLEDDMAVTDVAASFPISLAAVSRHLATLTAAGLIRQDRRGRIIWCKLEPDGMRSAAIWMRGFGQMDPLDLDDFERFLRAELSAGDRDNLQAPD